MSVVLEKEQIFLMKLFPLYKVLLHNDETHSFEEVIHALVASVPLSMEEAASIMLEAHGTGVALVLTCRKEEAEYYQERLQTYRLAVTIEAE